MVRKAEDEKMEMKHENANLVGHRCGVWGVGCGDVRRCIALVWVW